MPTGTPPTRVPDGSAVMSGSPSAIGSTSRHSSERVACSPLSIPWISCSSSSSTRGLCLVLRAAVPANWSPLSLMIPLLLVRRSAGPCSLLVQGAGLVHRGLAGLVALELVLRLVLAGLDRSAGLRRLGGYLALDGALDLLAVAVPGDVVTLLHVVRPVDLPGARRGSCPLPGPGPGHTSPVREAGSPVGALTSADSSRSVRLDEDRSVVLAAQSGVCEHGR